MSNPSSHYTEYERMSASVGETGCLAVNKCAGGLIGLGRERRLSHHHEEIELSLRMGVRDLVDLVERIM